MRLCTLPDVEHALLHLERVGGCGVDLSASYAAIIRACGHLRAALQAKIAHRLCAEHGHDKNRFLANLLIEMYGKCGLVEESKRVFDTICDPNQYSWTLLISAFAQNGQPWSALALFRKMQQEGCAADAFTFTIAIAACSSIPNIQEGRRLHHSFLASGISSSIVSTSLINLYGKCGDLQAARQIFDGIDRCDRDILCWNSMIAVYAQHQQNQSAAFRVLREMDLEGVRADASSFVSLLTASSTIDGAKMVIERAATAGFSSNPILQTAIVSIYGRLGLLDEARKAFDCATTNSMNVVNGVVSWSAMIAAYAHHGRTAEAMGVFSEMDLNGIKPDAVAFVNLLSACNSLASGRRIHARIESGECGSIVVVRNAMVSMYGRLGSAREARNVFDRTSPKSVVSWNAMLAAYASNGNAAGVVELYKSMEEAGMEIDSVSVICLLDACAAGAGDLAMAERAFGKKARGVGLGPNSGLGLGLSQGLGFKATTAMVNLYGKCGRVGEARSVFDGMQRAMVMDVVGWNAMIAAYAQHGHEQQAVELYWEMGQDGVLPNESSLSNVLCAISYGGRRLWDAISFLGSVCWDFGIVPKVEHYACLVDLLGRAGWLQEAEDVLRGMPYPPTEAARMCLLNACKLHGSLDRAARISKGDFGRSPASYVMMSNIFKGAA